MTTAVDKPRPSALRAEHADDPDETPWRRVAGLFRSYRWSVAGLVLIALAQGIAGVISPFLLREIIDRALPERSASLVSWFAGGMIAAAALTAALGVLSTRQANLIGQRVMHDLRVRVFEHLQRMSLQFFTRTRSGELQSRIANNVGGVDIVITTTASGTVQNVIAATAVGVAALIMAWKLALICLVVVPLFLVLTLRLGRQRRAIARGRQRRLAGLTALVEESLSVPGVLLSKTVGGQGELARRFADESQELSRTEMTAAMNGRWVLSSRRASLTMIPAIVYWVAGLALAHGSAPISIGTAVAFTSMLNRLVGPATALQGIGLAASTSMALFGRIFEVLDLPVDLAEKPDARALPQVRGEVRLEGVSFRYEHDGSSHDDPNSGGPNSGGSSSGGSSADGASDWTLREIELVVPPGTSTAIVGETGSGKTTLAYLIARLYDVTEGSVKIDGVDVRDLRLDAVAGAVGLVSQDTYLFHTTVRENLRFAAPAATDTQIEAAVRAAHIHDLLAGLPDGYETVVGSRGYRFSGGERQRLAIARMLLRDPPVLVLDEATSALDNQTERAVQAALDELSRGRTTVAIAHRLSTVRNADQIVVLDHGRIVERGTHDELIARAGRYAELAGELVE